MNIVFMGTPDFAVPSLEALIHEHTISGVVTAPDKPAGRGKKMMQPAVKKFALQHGLPVFQPEKLKSQEFIQVLKELEADVFVVVAFRMLPEVVWSLPRYGTFNLHASLLPQYRGAAPINHAIINGETETGATTFFIDENIDTGNIILQEKIGIGPEENAGELHDRLMIKGAKLVKDTVDLIEKTNGKVHVKKQKNIAVENLKKAPKINKSDCQINWKDNGLKVYNFIRGLSPYPGAWTMMQDKNGHSLYVKIYKACFNQGQHGDPMGTIKSNKKTTLSVVVKDGLIEITELQLEGKKRMETGVFLLGFKNMEDYHMV